MIIQYNQANIYKCNEMRLIPGINEVKDHVWNDVKDHPLVKLRIETGKIVVKDVELKPQGKEVTAPGSDAVEPASDFALQGLNTNDAKLLIQDTLDLKLLDKWKAQETRKGVQEAIEKQIEFLTEDEDEEDESEAEVASEA